MGPLPAKITCRKRPLLFLDYFLRRGRYGCSRRRCSWRCYCWYRCPSGCSWSSCSCSSCGRGCRGSRGWRRTIESRFIIGLLLCISIELGFRGALCLLVCIEPRGVLSQRTDSLRCLIGGQLRCVIYHSGLGCIHGSLIGRNAGTVLRGRLRMSHIRRETCHSSDSCNDADFFQVFSHDLFPFK
jgi:hypothetical protein